MKSEKLFPDACNLTFLYSAKGFHSFIDSLFHSLVSYEAMGFDACVFARVEEAELDFVLAVLEVVVPIKAVGCAVMEVGCELHHLVFLAVNSYLELRFVAFVGA